MAADHKQILNKKDDRISHIIFTALFSDQINNPSISYYI